MPAPPLALRRAAGGAVIASALLAARPLRADDAASVSWATAQAMNLTRQGQIHMACTEATEAIASYHDALSFDATYGPAYLGLAAAYEAVGDVKEAERTFAVGIDHVPGFADALLGRGRLRAALHRVPEAIVDFQEAASLRPDDLGVLRELEHAYVTAGALPAALAAARRLALLADEQHDARAAAEARVSARALALLVGDADPVTAGRAGRGEERRAIWAWARRR